MIILVCGSRHAMDTQALYERYQPALEDWIVRCWKSNFPGFLLLHGDCEGVDRMAGDVAWEEGIGVISIAANWSVYGKKAGPIRNRWMLQLKPDLVEAFHHDFDHSKGTKDMITAANKAKIQTGIIKV